MRNPRIRSAVVAVTAAAAVCAAIRFAPRARGADIREHEAARQPNVDRAVSTAAATALEDGRFAFRYDTFGDEDFWGGTLGLHRAIEGAALGGVGPGVSPKTALGVGLKIDVDALPRDVQNAVAHGRVNLDDPATTLALLRLNAVVGVTGFFDSPTSLSAVGIQCALCHSTVDDSFAPGIGRRLDGWPNRDLNVGAIISLAPNLQPIADLLGTDVATVKTVLAGWGPGKFDAQLLLDGKGFRPDGKTAATLLPAAYGLAGVNLHTYTGWGSIPQWNAFVAVLEMHGKGTYHDVRLDDAAKFPVAASHGFGHVDASPDRVTPKLASLQAYQLSLVAPTPPDGSFDAVAAERGAALFAGTAKCATCHVPPLFTEPGWNMHTAAEIGIDDFQASRSPDGRYRTTPLKGLFARAKGGFYHDGRFATLRDVVDHYDATFSLGLSAAQKEDLVAYLKSL
jgi:cytochrome c peroxidase